MARNRIPLQERLLSHIVVRENGCWEWTGTLKKSKSFYYGDMKVDGRHERAHRVSYQTFVGPIPKGMLVCHTCDNTMCINPEHLFLGTNKDNIEDMIRKGRGPNQKLDWDMAREIRRLSAGGMRGNRIAKQFGVSPKQVSYIINNERWIE